MKNKLPEYYQPSEDDIKRLWNEGTIVLDANVLLNLFRYSTNSREELYKILEHYQDRLWIPYQVAFEFLENSKSLPASLSKVISDTLKKIDSLSGALDSILELNKFDKYHLLKPEDIRKETKKLQDRLHDKIEKIKKEYEAVDKEAIVDKITDLFNGKVGEDFDDNTLENLYKEGERRYKEKVPPGFKDLEEKKGAPKRHLYGDLIWWKQAIEYAKTNSCDLVIVTDDAKEDWWYKVENETKSPRVELIKEFNRLSGRCFHMYRTGRFMELAKKYDKVSISSTSIKEVKETKAIDYGKLIGHIDSSLWGLPNESSIGVAQQVPSLYGSINPNNPFGELSQLYSGITGSQLFSSTGLTALGQESELSGLTGYLSSGQTMGSLAKPTIETSDSQIIQEIMNRRKGKP